MARMNWDRVRRERRGSDWGASGGGHVSVSAGQELRHVRRDAERMRSNFRTEWRELPKFGQMRASGGSVEFPLWLDWKAPGKRIVRMPWAVVDVIEERVPLSNWWEGDDDPPPDWRPIYDLAALESTADGWINEIGRYAIRNESGIHWAGWEHWKHRFKWREMPVGVMLAFHDAVVYPSEPWPIISSRPRSSK